MSQTCAMPTMSSNVFPFEVLVSIIVGEEVPDPVPTSVITMKPCTQDNSSSHNIRNTEEAV